MSTKLTLTIEKGVISRAKQYAQKTGRSLSDLVESYLTSLVDKDSYDQGELPSKIKKLFGSVSIPKDLDHKKEIRKIIQSKQK
ncbi:MAG: DUF6364 family protein [Bacteroidota bacterium]